MIKKCYDGWILLNILEHEVNGMINMWYPKHIFSFLSTFYWRPYMETHYLPQFKLHTFHFFPPPYSSKWMSNMNFFFSRCMNRFQKYCSLINSTQESYTFFVVLVHSLYIIIQPMIRVRLDPMYKKLKDIAVQVWRRQYIYFLIISRT